MTTTQNQVYQLANVGYDLYYIFNKFIVKNDDAFSDLKNILPNITYCSCLNMFIWNVCKSDRMLITHTVTSHKCDPSLCIQTALQALILCGTWADSLAAYYTEMVTGQYFSISPAAVVGCDEPGFFLQKSQHMNNLELSKQPNVLQQWCGLG